MSSSDAGRLYTSIFSDAAEYRGWAQRCLITVPVFDRGMQAYTIIDVRESAEYSKGHIPGAINLSVAGLDARSFLSSKNLLLMNEGATEVELIRACRQLRENGFPSVRVLDGGLRAFSSYYGTNSIVGGGGVTRAISARDLYIESQFRPVVILQSADSGVGGLLNRFEHGFVVEDFPSPESLAQLISQVANSGVSNRDLLLVFVATRGVTYSGFKGWADAIERSGFVGNLVYLDGGSVAYESFMRFKESVIEKQRRDVNGAQRCAR